MPFVQMENIALFLKACQSPPLNLHQHDVFLTVDLYESKDPAQVLQCIGAFSRAANKVQPSRFPNPIGGKSRSGVVSPQDTGYGNRGRGFSNASNTSSAYGSKPAASVTPMRTGDSNSGKGQLSPGAVSTWSKKSDEISTAPAWNIAQYGYMGGASQGNLGVAFGSRRQITSAGPHVPSLAEKEKKRKEEEERRRKEAEEEEQRKRREIEAEEERARIEEEKRWEEETRKLREQEKQRREEEKRKWEEEERQWKLEEERRRKEDEEAEARLREERNRLRSNSDARLQGQFLSQYQAEIGASPAASPNSGLSENSRIQELERELAEARERERQYLSQRASRSDATERDRLEAHDFSSRMKEEDKKSRSRSRSRPRLPARKDTDEVWREQEREYLQQQWAHSNDADTEAPPPKPPRPLPEPAQAPAKPPRPLPDPTVSAPSPRPLPDPAAYAASKAAVPTPSSTSSNNQNRTDRFLSSNPAPPPVRANVTYSNEIGGFDSSAERDAEDRRRVESQTKTKAGGWASKSLLEREMELERQRQREWEEAQKETQNRTTAGNGVDGIGGGIGGKWDVSQWSGYTGGDGQNRGTQGIGAGRRQIVGPRPPPGR